MFSETSVDFQRTTWRYILEGRTTHNHRYENLKSYTKYIHCKYIFYFSHFLKMILIFVNEIVIYYINCIVFYFVCVCVFFFSSLVLTWPLGC
jgi:hypothetical protein